ncbi:DUF4333 domain-containing protein [Mycolicibacterium grossiae]|uniref:DUF4333 domain-containing protein n=1 Tax=Mycolicibacterium grossiae TaxID=1552759 RepID=A0A1E8Q2R9_9MYCO|nr:DUF4333 domain-containing protein [Mycolicibacterium grossiae]OFJ52852.1 hypothetical protein BEL07_15355 [Mycolicibacterium grossiae]QEM46404.1 DUF4333 domain-containing protein [Mycolicibacterium grossiae]
MTRTAIVGAALVPLLGALLAGCGSSTIKPDATAQFLVDTISEQTSFTPKDVRCPDGIEAKTGVTFDCTFTGPENAPYVAHMKIVGVQGEIASYEWDMEPVT